MIRSIFLFLFLMFSSVQSFANPSATIIILSEIQKDKASEQNMTEKEKQLKYELRAEKRKEVFGNYLTYFIFLVLGLLLFYIIRGIL
jgi:hypothetical protein